MIPKIIHYCWFGAGEMSAMELNCIDSWKQYFPDYKFIEWNEERFDINFCSVTKEAYELKKYAFVSDVVRFYALNKYGGIYLDTDVLLLKKIPSFILNSNFFVCKENKDYFNAAVLGSIKENPFLISVLNFYKTVDTISYRDLLVTKVVTSILKKFNINDDFIFLSPDYFYPLPYQYRNFHYRKFLTKNTVGVHLWNLSWKENPHISLLDIFSRYFKYWFSYFYIPSSFKKFRDNSFY